jgi:uncharacterized protein
MKLFLENKLFKAIGSFKKGFILLFCLCFTAGLTAQLVPAKLLPAKPNPPKLVVDYANLLTDAEEKQIESKLVAYNDSTSNQILVLTVTTTHGYAAVDFATEVGTVWGVGGQAKFDNGVVILISDGSEETGNRRKAFIATGYGLEGKLNAGLVGEIFDKELKPLLQVKQYFNAINGTTNAIIKAASGEYKAPADYNKKGKKPKSIVFTLIIIAVILLLFLGSRGGGGGGTINRRGYSSYGPGPFWMGGSGGFGGFGGGNSGGGGAGGDW